MQGNSDAEGDLWVKKDRYLEVLCNFVNVKSFAEASKVEVEASGGLSPGQLTCLQQLTPVHTMHQLKLPKQSDMVSMLDLHCTGSEPRLQAHGHD